MIRISLLKPAPRTRGVFLCSQDAQWYAFGMTERLRKLWWYIFVFLLPWQMVWILREVFVGGEKWQYATVGLYASNVALLACATFLILRAPREVWWAVRRDAVARILFALFVWSLLSVLWAMEKDMALLSAWRVFLMTIVYVCARYAEISLRKTLAMFLVSMTFQATLAFGQWAGQYVSPSSLFGIAEHDPARWGTFVLKTESGRFLRAYGGFEHPNVLGGALAIAAVFGVWLSATASRSRLRIVLLATTLLMSFALVFTFSRSGWMAFLAGGIVLSFFAVKRSNYRVLFVLLIMAFSFLTGFFLVRDIAMSRFSDETIVRDGSLSDRAAYFDQALGAIRERPVLGVGGGNFTAFAQERFSEAGRFVGDFQPVHMVPLLVFAELGAVGFMLFVLLFIFAFVQAWRARNSLAGAILCALLPILFLDHWLWSGHFGMVFLGFVLGVIALSSVSSSR